MKKVLVIFTIIIILAVVGGWLFKMVYISQDGSEEIRLFEIEQGLGVNAISRDLKNQGFLDNSFVFETYLWLKKYENNIQAGKHYLSADMSIRQLVNNLISGTSVSNEMELTFLPGWNLREVFPEGMKKHCTLDFDTCEK